MKGPIKTRKKFWKISKPTTIFGTDTAFKQKNNDMKKRVLSMLISLFTLSAGAQIKYPATRTEPFDTIIYNTTLTDPYSWLSQKQHETEMLKWAHIQDDFSSNMLDQITGDKILMDVGYKLMEPNPDEISLKGVQHNDLYYYKMMPDNQRWLVKRTGYQGKEEKILSLPLTIKNKKYQVKQFFFAHNKPLLAIMLTEKGEANPHLRFFDLNKKEFLLDSIAPVMFNDSRGVSAAWLPDDGGIIYSQAPIENSAEENYYRGKLRLHLLDGKNSGQDISLFGQDVIDGIDLNDFDVPYVYSFPHSPYIIARVRAGKGDNYAFAVHYSNLNGAKTPWRKLQRYTCNDGMFTAKDNFIYAISEDEPNMQIIKVNLETGTPPVVLQSGQSKLFANIIGAKEVLYLKYATPGKDGILKMGYDKPTVADLPMPFDGAVGGFEIMADNDLLFGITNWIRSDEYYSFSPATNTVALLAGSNSGVATEKYTSKVIYVPSRDGMKIPVSLVYPKNVQLGEKPMPLLIDAYGCFGTSMSPAFLPEVQIWLSQGGIFAEAHIRGGGELGAAWYKSGSYPTKMNSINDVVDVAEYFVKNKYTQPSQQIISGGSCGTLNVGLAILQRPDLFCAGLYEVGIPDLVTNKGSSFGKGQNEFGPLDTEDGFKSRLSISAFHHIIENKKAPAMLMVNGANDYIVPLHNVARYVAKLQNVQQSERPALFMVDWQSGHQGAGTNPQDMLRRLKFILWQSGHKDFQLKSDR